MCSSHCGMFLLLFVLREVVTEKQHDLCKLSFPEDMAGEPSVTVTDADVQQCDGYGAITEAMVNMNILPNKKSSCYTMKKVSRLITKDKTGDTTTGISITIHFEENLDNSFSGNGKGDVSQSSTGSGVTRTCWSSSGAHKRGFLGQQSMSMVQGSGEGDNNTKNNTTGVYAATSKNKSNTDDDGGGLSHTQVVVIATCSSVIGTFFIVAAVLRIRNYLKRWREEQARRNNYRGCGMAPPRPACNTSRECLQRDSTSSKGSRQSGSTTKGGNRYFPVNSHGVPNSPTASPNHCLATDDTNPLLVVTAPSTVPNSPTDSHASIQFIDEEADKNKTSVIKEAEEEHEEQEPLITTAELPVEAPATMTTSVDSISSEDEVCNDDSPACCLSSRTEKPTLIREPTIEEEKLLGNNTSTNNKCEVENIPNNENLLSDDSSISNDMSSPSSSDVNMLPDMLSVTVGLTQSDESLTCSHNASYSYGNQTEYSSQIYDLEVDFGSCGNYDADMSISPECDSKDISDSEDTSKLLDAQPIGSSSLSSSPDQCDDNADVNSKDICGNFIQSPREKLTSQDSTISYNDNEIIPQTQDSHNVDQNNDINIINVATDSDKVQSQV